MIIPIGTSVIIKNTTLSGAVFYEGRATIKSEPDERGFYAVEFDSEPGELYQRRVEAEQSK